MEIENQGDTSFYTFEESYFERRSHLIPLDYIFLVTFGEVALREGHMRRAVEITREALAYAHHPNERALIYLSLSRMYRMMIHMQNARAELKRAFQALDMEYPERGLFRLLSVLPALFPLFFMRRTQKRFASPELEERNKILIALHEEAGLSAYYMHRSSLLLFQISLHVRKMVSGVGFSFEMVNYRAATATMFAIYQMRYFAEYYLSQAKKVAVGLHNPAAVAKCRSWEVLLVAYLGDAALSAGYAESLLTEQKNDLTPYGLRLVCTTLSTNYVIRGKTRLSLRAIDQMMTPYDATRPKIFSGNKTFIEWYKIPALSFHGEEEAVEEILVNSRAIFSSTDEEKWQIMLYLGNVLIYYYLSSSRDFNDIKNVLDRFHAIKLSSRHTFLEAQHFWIGKAYLFLELFHNKEIDLQELKEAVSDVKHMTRLETVKSHHFILTAHLYCILRRYAKAYECVEAARLLAKKIDNDWVLYEADKLSIILCYAESRVAEGAMRYQELSLQLTALGWEGCRYSLEKLVNKYK